MYKLPPSTFKALEWGKSHEDTAWCCIINKKLATHGNSCKVVTTGIHVYVGKSWLAGSHDGLVEGHLEPAK